VSVCLLCTQELGGEVVDPEVSNTPLADVSTWLREGIAAAKAGQRERARDLLLRVVARDEENISAWLWLSDLVDSLEEREVCLENVLALDPANEAARKGLAWLQKQQEGPVLSRAQPTPAPEAPSVVQSRAAQPVTLAAAILREDLARRRPPPEAEPEPPPAPLRDEFDDEYLCPYCAAPTDPPDRLCRACGNGLWIQVRRREERSSWLWLAMTLQAIGILWPAIIVWVALFLVGNRVGVSGPSALVPAYLGLTGDVPPEVVDAAFELVPRHYVLLAAFLLLFSVTVFVGLYLRWKPIFYLFLVNALLTLVSAIAGIALGQRTGAICGGGGVLLALAAFFLVLQIEDDFFFNERRITLRFDRDATNGPALLDSGRRYAKRQLWAMAAIHLRSAASRMPDEMDCHLALAVTYINLKRYDLAEKALAEARRIRPEDPQVERLAALLASQRPVEA